MSVHYCQNVGDQGHLFQCVGWLVGADPLFEVDDTGAMVFRKERRHRTGWKEPCDFAIRCVGGVLQDLSQARVADQLCRSAWTSSRAKGHYVEVADVVDRTQKNGLGLGSGRLCTPFENST